MKRLTWSRIHTYKFPKNWNYDPQLITKSINANREHFIQLNLSLVSKLNVYFLKCVHFKWFSTEPFNVHCTYEAIAPGGNLFTGEGALEIATYREGNKKSKISSKPTRFDISLSRHSMPGDYFIFRMPCVTHFPNLLTAHFIFLIQHTKSIARRANKIFLYHQHKNITLSLATPRSPPKEGKIREKGKNPILGMRGGIPFYRVTHPLESPGRDMAQVCPAEYCIVRVDAKFHFLALTSQPPCHPLSFYLTRPTISSLNGPIGNL